MAQFRALSLLLTFLLSCCSAAEDNFWVVREEPLKDKAWVAYVPAKEDLAKQAVLLYAELPSGESPILVRQVLSQMYRQVKDLKVLGRKPVQWRQGDGTLVSFSGYTGKRRVVGRAVIASTERGTEVFMLVRHPQSNPKIVESYEQVRQSVDTFLGQEKEPKE